jgi:leucine dehydrogenase
VQDVGHVGLHLCYPLHEAGAEILVADLNRDNLKRVHDELPVTDVASTDVLYSDVGVLAPCALGNVLSAETIPHVRTKVIAGAANNQLATEDDGTRLAERGILYAPDYVINAGGVIGVAREYLRQSSEDEVRKEISCIPEQLRAVFANAEATVRPTNLVADELAHRIVAGRGNNVVLDSATDRLIA